MQEIGKTLLLVSAIAALSAWLLPVRNKKLRRAGELGIALFVLAALVNPITALSELRISLDGLRYPALELPGGEYGEETRKAMEKAVGEGVAKDIAARYGVREADVSVVATLSLADNELSVSSLAVTLSHTAAALDIPAVRAYLEKTYTPVCEVKTHVQ
jgi:hypothetical protein